MKDIKLKFDVGAILILKDECGYNMLKMSQEEMQDADFIVALVYVTAIRGGNKIALEDIKNMSLKEFEPLIKRLDTAMKEGMAGMTSELFKFDKKAATKWVKHCWQMV